VCQSCLDSLSEVFFLPLSFFLWACPKLSICKSHLLSVTTIHRSASLVISGQLLDNQRHHSMLWACCGRVFFFSRKYGNTLSANFEQNHKLLQTAKTTCGCKSDAGEKLELELKGLLGHTHLQLTGSIRELQMIRKS
jgi:hypothetical protein